MLTRRAPPNIVLTVETRRKFASLASLFINVDKRNGKKSRSKKNEKTELSYKDIGPWACGPCFFRSLIYLKAITGSLLQYLLSILKQMIDTIVLTLTSNAFHITDSDKFIPSARWINNAMHEFSGIASKQNPQKRELRAGIYKPCLTLSPRIRPLGNIEPMLKIELSLPKLFWGNNFDELQYKDFKPLVVKLQKMLCGMGVQTTIEALTHAPVSAIHYSKNIPLTDGSTPYHYIQKIREVNVKRAIDVNMRDYRNEGHCFKWHCNSYEVLFYDKIKDLEKAKQSSKRAIEKDSALQLHLFDKFQQRNKFEVLRMEVRLNKRQKIKQLFRVLGIKADLTFKKLFKPAISKKILLHYLDEIANKRPVLLDYTRTSLKSLVAALITNNPRLSLSRLFRLLGLKYALESATWRELQNMIPKYGSRSWYYLMADMKKVKLPILISRFGTIREQLVKFKALKIEKFKKTNTPVCD